jgi:hypothetical protein
MIRIFLVAGLAFDYSLIDLFNDNRMYYDFSCLLKTLRKQKLSFFDQSSTDFGPGHYSYTKGQELLSLVSLLRLLIDPKEAGHDIVVDLNALYTLLRRLYVKDE